MYHIKKDKRAEISTEMICDAMLKLLETSTFSEITVSDIQRASTVSRSTFYRNFDCLEDVLSLLCDKGFAAAIERQKQTGEVLREADFRYWFANSKVLEVLVQINRTDILMDSFRRCSSMLERLRSRFNDENTFDYFSGIVSSVMISIMTTWVKHGKTESEEDAMKRVKKAFSKLVHLGFIG